MAFVMGTSSENILTNFDLDLLLSPASSSIFENSGNTNHGYQAHNIANTSSENHDYQIHSMGNLETTDYSYQVQNVENELYKQVHIDNDVVKKSEYEALQKDYKAKSNDYDAVKRQYAKIALDYAKLHDENKKHALEALNVSDKNEQLEKQESLYQAEIKALREQIERLQTNNFAQNSSLVQYQSYVVELQNQNADLKNDVKNEKLNGRDGRKMISTLNNTNQTLTEHLCLFACIIEDRRQVDKETRRLIKKYCKKNNPSSKKNVEVESFENQSVDTGRGSSLAFSDGDRSFYSPAYSINFSPPSTVTSTKMRDAASSPPPMIKTLDVGTSPIHFQKPITLPPVKTLDVATSPIVIYEASTPKKSTRKLLHIATSPIEFADTKTPTSKINALDIATSPIQFADTRSPEAKTKTLDLATSPIKFETKMSNIATSPVKFPDTRSQVVKTKTLDIATSPVKFADTMTMPKTKMTNIATSPVKFADTSPVAKTKTLDIATSPVKFADTITIPKMKMMNIATSPVKFADTRSPVAKSKTLDIATRPVKFADTITMPKSKITNIHTSPVKFADTSTPVAKTKTFDSATSSKEFSGTRTLVVDKKMLDIVSCPIEIAQVRTPVPKTKTLGITRPNKCADVITSVAKKIKFDMTSSKAIRAADARTSVPKTTTEMVSVSNKISPNSRHTNTSENSTCHLNEITEKLKEIESQHSDHSQEDAENDREIKMILRKHSLDWNMLSPIALTPELDQEDEQTQSDGKDNTKEQGGLNLRQTEIRNLIQSLHISGDEDSDDEIDREDGHFSRLVIESPQHLVNDEDAFDLMQNINTVNNSRNDSQNNNSNSLSEDVELPNELYNKSHAKSKKYKKLSNLQKLYKANMPKSKIKSQLSPVKKQHAKPNPCTISPIKYSSASLPQNKDVRKLSERNAKTLIFQKPNDVSEVSNESIKCTFKKPQPLSEYCPKRRATESGPTSECEPYTQTKPQYETVPNNRVCMSTETQSNSSGLSHTQTNKLPVSDSKTKESTSTDTQANSISALPQTQTNLQLKIGTSVCMPTKTQSNSISGLPHTQTKISPESGRKRTLCMPTKTQTNSKNETNQIPESSPSLQKPTELINEYELAQCYSKPPNKRISRVVNNISKNPPVLPIQTASNTNKRKSCTADNAIDNSHGICEPPKKKNRANNDVIINDVLEGEGTNQLSISSQEDDQTKEKSNIDNNKTEVNVIIVDSGNNKNSLRSQQNDTSLIVKSDTSGRPDDSNINSIAQTKSAPMDNTRHFADYNDMSMFTTQDEIVQNTNPKGDLKEVPEEKGNSKTTNEWEKNLLDRMIFKYGSNSKPPKRPIYDAVLANKFETGIANCVELSQKPDEYKKALKEFVSELEKHGLKKIINGLMKYLNNAARKADFVPVSKPQKGQRRFAMTVTKSEMVLIDVIVLLEQSGITLWDIILDSCEYILFSLERGATPVFDIVESVAHLYANICKYRGNVSRLWMFMLNAMYCLSFKAIPLIKHCLDVVPRVLPLPNTYKDPVYAPMIRCLVFLLHFYNCEDPFRRVQEIRERLKNQYYYNLQDENETTILFLLKNSIVNLSERKLESDILELVFLIMAKRRGTKWCHKNIVQKILLPMIKGEIDVSHRGKRFCITTLGQILKPYKNEMTVHSEEVVNLLTNMFEQSQPHEIKEDIIRGLINMNMKSISQRINRCLINWNPDYLSPELEEALEDYIHSKPISKWQIVYQNFTREI